MILWSTIWSIIFYNLFDDQQMPIRIKTTTILVTDCNLSLELQRAPSVLKRHNKLCSEWSWKKTIPLSHQTTHLPLKRDPLTQLIAPLRLTPREKFKMSFNLCSQRALSVLQSVIFTQSSWKNNTVIPSQSSQVS
jgi:hypothetical protein